MKQEIRDGLQDLIEKISPRDMMEFWKIVVKVVEESYLKWQEDDVKRIEKIMQNVKSKKSRKVC